MTQWKYLSIGPKSGETLGRDYPLGDGDLDSYGALGWELVTANIDKDGRIWAAVLKRPDRAEAP